MHIAIPVRPSDIASFKGIIDAASKRGSLHRHKIILIPISEIAFVAEEAKAKLGPVCNDIEIMSVQRPVGGPIQQASKMLVSYIQRLVETGSSEPTLWLTGNVTLKADGWADALEDEYTGSFKHFLWTPESTPPGISEPIIFGPRIAQLFPTWRHLKNTPWVQKWAHVIAANGKPSTQMGADSEEVKVAVSPSVDVTRQTLQAVPWLARKSPAHTKTTHSPEDMRMTEFSDMVRSSPVSLRVRDVAARMNMQLEDVQSLAERTGISINRGWLTPS